MNEQKLNQLASIFDGLDFEMAINTLEWDVLTCEEQMYVERACIRQFKYQSKIQNQISWNT